MIGRIIWWTLLLVVAGVATGVQLDRQARKTPELAPLVPELFRSASQPRITALAIESGSAEAGLAEAQRLIQRRPLPARHLRLLAQAQFASGQAAPSSLSIQYAAQRGWRDSMAQQAVMELALAADDRAEAARRFAALFLIRGTDRDLLENAAARVFAMPAGEERTVFAEIVTGGDRWHNAFLTRGARILPADAFAQVVETSMENGAKFPCPALTQALRFIASKDAAAGERLARLQDARC